MEATNEPKKISDNTAMDLRRYIFIIVLFAINLLNYIDRYTVAGVLGEIQSFFKIDDASAGLIQTIFIVFYMIFAPIFGFFGDRYNRKWILTIGISVWVAAVLASSFVPENFFWLFLLLRGVVGVGEASYATIAPTIIADLFTGVFRSRVLMFFYFAIPVGSGLGYMIGSTMANIMGEWVWGVRVTPIFGLICLILTITVIEEPKRGLAEGIADQDSPSNSYFNDLLQLCRNKTYVASTIGYTAVVFVIGTMSWWAPTAIQHSYAVQKHLNNTDELEKSTKSNIALIFGAITVLGGLVGVSLGIFWALLWKEGRFCLKSIQTHRADPLVCALGSALAVPFMFLGLHMIGETMIFSWVFIFLAITMMCLNWAVNVDMLLSVIPPSRRSTANAFQILTSHLFGDASGPYLIGLISDAMRGGDSRPDAHFRSLINAFYVANAMLVLSAVMFFVAALTIEKDKLTCNEQMGISWDVRYQKSTREPNRSDVRNVEHESGADNQGFHF